MVSIISLFFINWKIFLYLLHFELFIQSNAILAGLGLAAVGFAGRYIMRRAPQMSQKLNEAMKAFPTAESLATSKYYRGGFEAKMNKREAALILGVSPTAPKTKVCCYDCWIFFK